MDGILWGLESCRAIGSLRTVYPISSGALTVRRVSLTALSRCHKICFITRFQKAMTVEPDSRKLTPEARLRAYVAQLDPKHQPLFPAVRAAVRKRFPTANELAYDYNDALVVGYAPGSGGSTPSWRSGHLPPVSVCISARDPSCPTRSGCSSPSPFPASSGDRESRSASSRWRRPAGWRIPTWRH